MLRFMTNTFLICLQPKLTRFYMGMEMSFVNHNTKNKSHVSLLKLLSERTIGTTIKICCIVAPRKCISLYYIVHDCNMQMQQISSALLSIKFINYVEISL